MAGEVISQGSGDGPESIDALSWVLKEIPGLNKVAFGLATLMIARIIRFDRSTVSFLNNTAHMALRNGREADALDIKQWLEGTLEPPEGDLCSTALLMCGLGLVPDLASPVPNWRSRRTARRIGNHIHDRREALAAIDFEIEVRKLDN